MPQIRALLAGSAQLDQNDDRRFIGATRLSVWGDADDVRRAMEA